MSLVLVGKALQKHFLLRSKSGFWFRSLVWVAERTEIAESFLVSLEILGYVWVACQGRACLVVFYYRNGQKSQKHYRNFLPLGGLLAGALGGCLYWLEKHYRNYSLSLIFRYGKKKKTSFLFTCS